MCIGKFSGVKSSFFVSNEFPQNIESSMEGLSAEPLSDSRVLLSRTLSIFLLLYKRVFISVSSPITVLFCQVEHLR